MSKAPVDIIKYIVHADAEAKGLVEKPDLIGAIFGQTEGLLGEDLDLRELQKSGRIGRIDADIKTKSGTTKAHVMIPSSLDMVETSIIAAGVETITRIGPCDASFKITQIEDVRGAKREAVVSRARELLKTLVQSEMPDTKEITEGIREDIRAGEIIKYRGLDAGSGVPDSDTLIIVEGRADVLTLLRNGIKNAVAVGGIKIPKEAVDLCNERVTTVFVDGDRGGDLIIKSLQNAGADIKYIAKAPTGREVEELSRKEVVMALRKKAAFAGEEEGTGRGSRSSSSGSRESRSGSSSSRESRSSSSRESSRTSRSRESRAPRGGARESKTRGGRSRDDRESRDRGSRPSRPSRGERERRPRRDEEESRPATIEDQLRAKLSELKNTAVLLDGELKETKKLTVEELKKRKKVDAYAIVMDDVIMPDIIKKAAKTKYIVGIMAADNLVAPKDKTIITKF